MYKARLSGLPAYLQCEIHDYHPSRTPRSTSALLLQQQPATISFAYHLQRERFVQPLLQSGTLLVSTPVQLIRFWHLRTGLKLNCLNLATHNCFWYHRSAPDSLANWYVGHVRNLFVWMYVLNAYIICHLTLVMFLHCLTLHKNSNMKLTSWSIDTWDRISQGIIDKAIDQWQTQLHACIKGEGRHFEHYCDLATQPALFRATYTPKLIVFRTTHTIERKTT